MPALQVVIIGLIAHLVDGFDSYAAGLKAGIKLFQVQAERGTNYEYALRKSLGANSKHGMRRSNADKHRAGIRALERWPELSDRQLGEMCRISHTSIANYRIELEAQQRQLNLPPVLAAVPPLPPAPEVIDPSCGSGTTSMPFSTSENIKEPTPPQASPSPPRAPRRSGMSIARAPQPDVEQDDEETPDPGEPDRGVVRQVLLETARRSFKEEIAAWRDLADDLRIERRARELAAINLLEMDIGRLVGELRHA